MAGGGVIAAGVVAGGWVAGGGDAGGGALPAASTTMTVPVISGCSEQMYACVPGVANVRW